MIAVGLTVAVCIVYLRAQGARELMPDEGIYSYVGWAWTQGDAIFKDAWEQKGPIVYVFPALRILLAGNAPEWVGFQEVALGMVTALAVAGAARVLWGSTVASFVFLFATALWTQLPPNGGGLISTAGSVISMLEALAVLVLTIGATSNSPRRSTIAFTLFGAFEALLFWCRPNAIVTLALLPCVLLFSPRLRARWIHSCVAASAGALCTLGLVAWWMYVQDSLDALFDIYFRFGPIRGALAMDGIGLPRVLERMLTEYRRLFVIHVFGLLALTFACSFARQPADSGRVGSREQERLARIISVFWVALALLGYASSGAFNHHALPSLAALAFAGGWILHSAWHFTEGKISMPLRAIALGVLTVAMVGRPLARALRQPRGNPAKTDWRRIADYVVRTTSPNDRILTITGFAGPAILTTSQRLSAVPWTFPMPLHARGYVTDSMWLRVARVLEGPTAVKTVLADLMSIPPAAPGDSTIEWTLRNVERGLMPRSMQDSTVFPSKERAKALLVQNYEITHCDAKVCVLSRRMAPARAESRRGTQ